MIISGGGTGGHIYPAIAVANEIKKRNIKNDVLFVGAKGRMEMEKVPKAGYHVIGLWISGLQRASVIKNLLFPLKLIMSLIKSYFIMTKFKPDAVIGFGGYASGPLVKVGARRGTPAVIQEQNAFAGITNQWLAKSVQKICVAHDGMGNFFPEEKIVVTGNPVREDIINPSITREEALKHFGLRTDKRTILILGGSLGARTINEAIMNHIGSICARQIQLIWQTGKKYIHEVDRKIKGKYGTVYSSDFIYEMDYAYKAADVVISRAGALSISELAVAGKASIFVPSPNVTSDHQTKNAEALVKQDAALMVKDGMAMETLIPLAMDLVKNDKKKVVLEKNILKVGKPDAVREITDIVEELIF